jgi:hypothetical protein
MRIPQFSQFSRIGKAPERPNQMKVIIIINKCGFYTMSWMVLSRLFKKIKRYTKKYMRAEPAARSAQLSLINGSWSEVRNILMTVSRQKMSR